jgi:hypothetical protein
VSTAVRQQAEDVVETARKAGIPPDDPLALLLAKLASLAGTVSASTAERQEELERAIFRAGLVVARQLAVRVERRTALAIGAAGVLIAVIAGYTGYEIGSAQPGPVAVCWQQGGKQLCGPAVWLGLSK